MADQADKVTELNQLLQDSTFVDFFNVFLSQPIFPQRLLYKVSLKEFEFDPPLRKSKHILDKSKLVKWLVTERLPLFYSTEIYHEYLLCQELLNTKLLFSESCHGIDYVARVGPQLHLEDIYNKDIAPIEMHNQQEDTLFKLHAVGNVVGMRQFKYYLKGTPGEKLFLFWMDAEKYKSIPTSELWVKWRQYRDMQTKYFKGKNIGTFDALQEGADVLEAAMWSGKGINYQINTSNCYANLQKEEIIKIMNSTDYSQIQALIVLVIKGYWLQRYFLHAKLLKAKQAEKAKDTNSAINVISQSDIAILKDIKEIDKALKLLQADKKPSEQVTKTKASFNWRAMFPENQVDGSYLNQEGEIVTLHRNGNITVDAIDSTLDTLLEQYIHSSSSDESCDEFIRQQIDMTEAIRAKSANQKPSLEQLTAKKDSKQNLKVGSSMDKASSSRQSLKLSKSSQNEALKEIYVNRQGAESIDIMKKAAKVQASQTSLKISHKNMHLFDQLLHLHFHTGNWEYDEEDEDDNMRPKSSPIKTSSSRNIVRLPSIFEHFTNRSGVNINKNEPLPPIEEQQMIYPEAKHVIPEPGHSVVEVEVPVFTYKNMCEGYFRYENQHLTLSIAVDSTAGSPFQNFLVKQMSYKRLSYIQFWNDVQCYLTTSIFDKALKDRRGKLLLVRYILNKNSKLLPSEFSLPLQNLLPKHKADELLREAQDFVCGELFGLFSLYCRKDKKKFTDSCIIRKSFHRRRISSIRESNSPAFDDNTVLSQPVEGNAETISNEVVFENDSTYTNKLKDADRERRMYRAAQFSLDAASRFEEGLPLEPLLLEELEWNVNNDYGSLAVEKLILVHRRDLVEYKERLKLIARQKKEKLELEKLRLSEKKKTDVHTDDTPFYMKAFKKAGIWFQRPIRPRTFQDVMKDPVHREFFRRFLIFHSAEVPMNFCNAIEDLKSCKDPRAKQNRMTQITRKYFAAVPQAIEMLNTNADIVQAIPSQEKVTMAMLISAQSWVARALNDNWFEKYQVTFPDLVADNLMTGVVRQFTDHASRQWGKDRTKKLWYSFANSIIHFRNDILNPNRAHLFELYLKGEIKKEIEKQKTSVQGYAHGMPIRKVIRNKLIDVTKLVNDMHFVAEADRYRTMCDDARSNANSGAYCAELEKLIESKAKMLVDCFIDSDIPPRTQVNLTQDQVEIIITTFRTGLVDRALFHHAMVNIFPVVGFLWKRFQKQMVVELYERWLAKHMSLKTEETPPPATKKRVATPDYRYATVSSITTKRVVAHKGEEDICKLHFSLTKGITMVLPLAIAPQHYGFGGLEASKEGADMLVSSSMMEMNSGPSFLRNRRHAVASSKVSVQGSQQGGLMNRPSSQAGRQSSLGRHNSQAGSRILNPHQSMLITAPILTEQASGEQLNTAVVGGKLAAIEDQA